MKEYTKDEISRTGYFIQYCLNSFVNGTNGKSEEEKNAYTTELSSLTINRDKNLLSKSLEYFAGYLGIIKSREYYNSAEIAVDLTLILVIIDILQSSFKTVNIFNGTFYVSFGPFGVFKKALTTDEVLSHIYECNLGISEVFEEARTWIESIHE